MIRISNPFWRTCLLLPVIALLGACQSPGNEPDTEAWVAHLETRTENGFTRCESPRPEMCTMIYQPVCGLVEDDKACLEPPCSPFQYRTLGNSCSACGLDEVVGHVDDECPDDLGTPET
ncbi:hypothetical protein [Marinimicrobium alkaliphilum]|uniref:hypothetical protein n=1 Tax=Marinimicrobium alkaliphilum TaxID=2202654 RepID=UPI000DBA0BF3|nr:hypothetical protein [Marinimicrobium alkaliphilum]